MTQLTTQPLKFKAEFLFFKWLIGFIHHLKIVFAVR